MMSTYIFILGKDPELSKAELATRYPSLKFLSEHQDFVLTELPEGFGQREFNMLGGQIKAGEVLAKATEDELVSAVSEFLSEDHDHGKLNYGLSIYGWPERNLKKLLTGVKKTLRKGGISSRFVNHDFKNLSAAQYKGLAGGPEILICKELDDFYIARVVAVQDIDAYSKRDFDKPFRSMKVGMLPPKLAQIMVNLTGVEGALWDPFCGGGVLLMEGLLMGHPMLGSDIDAATLNGARQNIEWLKKNFEFKAEADLFLHDANDPLPEKQFAGIACEGYLGPPQERRLSKADSKPIVDELSALYKAFFQSLARAGFKGPVVIALPFFRGLEGEIHLDEVIAHIKAMGFQKELDIVYIRYDQLVGRRIFRLRLS